MKKSIFRPQRGQVDYTNIRWAPVINCVIRYQKKILLVQRSRSLHFYPGYWNGVSGFLDDRRSVEGKVASELAEELGLSSNTIEKIRFGEIFHQDEPKYKKTWIVHPVLVEVNTNRIKLDWEAQRFQWVTLRKAMSMKLLPGFDQVLKKLSPWIRQ